MMFVSQISSDISQSKIESLLKERYINISDKLFAAISKNDTKRLNSLQQESNLLKIDDISHYLKYSKPIYQHTSEFSTIKILLHEDGRYILYLSYLDEEFAFIDSTQDSYFEDKNVINILIGLDVFVLFVIFIIIIKALYPLKTISNSIKAFGRGEYKSRVEYKNDDEIGVVAKTFNQMGEHIETIIEAREQLLRDISHELKTPISKAKLSLEMMEESKYKHHLDKAITQMDNLVHQLLDLERLNANLTNDTEEFDVETLIVGALDALLIEDDSKVEVVIEENRTLKADKKYMIIALKNLIDNGLKHSQDGRVKIYANSEGIDVISIGNPLEKSLEYYCQIFTKMSESRGSDGHGLGLSIVKKVVENGGYALRYFHEDSANHFQIIFA